MTMPETTRALADSVVCDKLASYLRRPSWDSPADFLDWCHQLVRATGRDLQNGRTDEDRMVVDGEYLATYTTTITLTWKGEAAGEDDARQRAIEAVSESTWNSLDPKYEIEEGERGVNW